MYSFEYIVDIYYEGEEGTKRIYGITFAKDDVTALANIGSYYNETIVRVVYFGCASEGEVYELNATYADTYKVEGRRFGKIIPPLVDYPEPENQ